MADTKTRRVAWALLLLLAMHEVSGHRVKVDMASADARVASGLAEATRVNGNLDAMKEAREFTIKTHWARGKESKLKWKEAELAFSIVNGTSSKSGSARVPAEYVQLTVGEEKYTIMPDAAVLKKTINGMAMVSIVGWKRGTEAPVYKKKDALYFRTEMNPVVGLTTESWRHWRDAGYKVYQPKDKKKNPYYIRKDGKMFVLEDDAELTDAEIDEPFKVQVAGQHMEMQRPDAELMLLVDTMLGQSSCLNNPSQCAFRCSYNPVKDTCGPSSFCSKVKESTLAGGRLAPFGQEQKCEAMGAEANHREADYVLANLGLEGLKQKTLDLVVSLEQAPPISHKEASQSTAEKTLALFDQASDILSTFRSLPARTSGKYGSFPMTSLRAAELDLRHWRTGEKPLTPEQYREARLKGVEELRGRQRQFSVAAKLHSGLVDFLVKRPKFMIEAAKAGSDKDNQCILSDDNKAAQEKLKLFVKYFLAEPGFNKGDVTAGTTGLGLACEQYILGGLSDQVLEKADKGENAILDKEEKSKGVVDGEEAGLLESASELQENNPTANMDAADAVGVAAPVGTEEVEGNLDEDLSLLQETDEAAFFWVLFCILACVFFIIIAGALFAAAGGALTNGSIEAYFVCGILGGLVIAGAFCMATPVGWVTLVGAIVAPVVLGVASSMTEVRSTKQSAEATQKQKQVLPSVVALSSQLYAGA